MMIDYIDLGIRKEDIALKAKSLQNSYDIFYFVDNSLKISLEKYFEINFENIVNDILFDLIVGRILRRKKGSHELLVGRLSIDKIKEMVINELKFSSGSLSERILKSNITIEYPSLNLIPNLGIWKTALKELEYEKLIHLEFRSRFKNSAQIYLNENYQRIQQRLKSLNDIPSQFFGRKISPDEFIQELLELELGDFADNDDQITRLAGLVLSESIKLQAPHEQIPEFDFSIDIKDYHFRPDQIEAMKKSNFEIFSEIIHCKVMLSDTLTLKKYEEIKNSLPTNEQVAVFTFKSIPSEIKQKLANDKSIQIIDEEGVKLWVAITSKIPSRKNSIAKLYSDPISKLEKKIVRINSINYENSLASVSVFPKMNEVTVLIGSLEEIPLNETSINDFEDFSNNYHEFLNVIGAYSTDSEFEKGFFDSKIQKTELIPRNAQNKAETSSEAIKRTKSEGTWIVKLENNTVKLSLDVYGFKNIFKCSCYYWDEKDHSFKFCNHMISALNHIGFAGRFFDETWEMGNSLTGAFKEFFEGNNKIIIKKLTESLEPEDVNILKQYLESYCKLKES